MSARRQVFPDTQGAADACARYVAAKLEQKLAARAWGTLAVSGGHTPKLMFQSLARLAVDWRRVHLFWVDERCVLPDDAASNYRLAKENLIAPAHIPEANIHRVKGELDPHEAARIYTDDIRKFFQLKADEMPRFDLVQCGMGPDGHTASLFPGEPLLDDRKGIATAVYAPQFTQWRVTLLPGPLLAARQLLYLVTGEDKAQTLRAVFTEAPNPKKLPSQIALEHPEGATWFLDEAAAKLLDS
ncbi:MAG TPA: 6-phosphogluconolactonase [Bryobacteraceae bacterium]|jgi:6-phosphogluconolactonase|nr:6-phosphogluconolactonase [Bryobacteraceae bacterium]